MRISSLIVVFLTIRLCAQFDGPGGELGSKSILNDASSIVGWATGVTLERGPMQINDTALGKPSTGSAADALNRADGLVVSLGDGGQATLSFDQPVINHRGYDFAIFENGFKVGLSYYLELAHVEVSENGIDFIRFPSESLTDTSYQTNNFSYTDPYQLYNLAGKHQAPYGTLFDLDEIGMDTIYFIRVIDVVGSVNDTLGTRDSKGRLINDPFPSPFESSGFDLDAVAMVNGELLDIQQSILFNVSVYPTVLKINQPLHIEAPHATECHVFDINHKSVHFIENNQQLYITQPGIYFVELIHQGKQFVQKICVQ